jgi:hypothetical protein
MKVIHPRFNWCFHFRLNLIDFLFRDAAISQTKTGIRMQYYQAYDAQTVAVLRRALDEVVADKRFKQRKAVSPLEIAEHLLAQAAAGERDIDRLKASIFTKISAGT